MTVFLVGGLWGALAGWWAWARTLPVRLPRPARHRTMVDASAHAESVTESDHGERSDRWSRVSSRTITPERRRLAAVGIGVVVAMALHPVLVAVPVLAALVLPRLDARRRRRARDEAVVDQLPDVVDLLRLTSHAGLPVAAAIAGIGGRPGGPIGAALASAGGLLARGATTSDVLGTLLATCGPTCRPLIDALADHDRYGTPLGPVLDRVAVDCRLRRRRTAEEAARRLPVTLLFPLVLTTLPAFALLTIVPLLVGSFSSLRL
jgi:tight adherence protein C